MTGAVVVAIAVVRASALRACASIEAIRAALSPCWWRRPATNRLRVSAASASERARAAAAAASCVSSASRAASRVSSAASLVREERACSMILLFCACRAAETVEARQRLLERLCSEQDGEGIGLARTARRGRGRARRAVSRRPCTALRAIASCLRAAARSRSTSACRRRDARGRAARLPQLRLERVELEGGRIRPSLERLVARAQRRHLGVRAGGVRSQRDRNRGDQQEARENGSETRRIARRMRPHEARTVASFGSEGDCL